MRGESRGIKQHATVRLRQRMTKEGLAGLKGQLSGHVILLGAQ